METIMVLEDFPEETSLESPVEEQEPEVTLKSIATSLLELEDAIVATRELHTQSGNLQWKLQLVNPKTGTIIVKTFPSGAEAAMRNALIKETKNTLGFLLDNRKKALESFSKGMY